MYEYAKSVLFRSKMYFFWYKKHFFFRIICNIAFLLYLCKRYP